MQEVPVFYYDQAALMERLTTGIQRSTQSVIFLVGSPLTAPVRAGDAGVPGVDGVVDIIRREFERPEQLIEFDKALSADANKYQAAFSFLLGRRGQQTANEVIKRAVWMARKPILSNGDERSYLPSATTTDDSCRLLDTDYEGWVLTPAAQALGQLIAWRPEEFGRAVLTTNFDPLLEVAISKAGGHFFRTVLHRDGNLGQTEGTGCHVIHLHGYWYGADTLHTPRQLNQSRPRLKASLGSLVKSKVIVISGYGGWDDTFTEALMEIVLDDNAFPEIIWTFHGDTPNIDERLLSRLAPGVDRGRVTLYGGIDCQKFFPDLLAKWESVESSPRPVAIAPPSARFSAIVSSKQVPEVSIAVRSQRVLEGGEEDRPPLTDVCVGRDQELKTLLYSLSRAVFITGFGGQGKSTVAARYFSASQQNSLFDLYVWRDCKEEGERFENQVIDVIERLSEGTSSAHEISQQPMEVLAELLAHLSGGRRILFVFDNVDHYVDLEQNRLSGNADRFLSSFLAQRSNCKILFTCRPQVQYHHDDVLVLNIEGLSIAAATELFAKRGALATGLEIDEAHASTSGHAFWLDLIAAQVGKSTTQVTLRGMLDQIAQGTGAVPAVTLEPIWKTLHDRQKIVLRAMAETVRPETDDQIAEYLRGRVNFNQVSRALRTLRDLNLIVIKPRMGSPDLLELHPLVREFIRRTFPLHSRISFIDAIIAVYNRFMGIHLDEGRRNKSILLLQHWTENAELCVEAGKLDSAFKCLADVKDAMYASDAPGEFARVAKLLFRNLNWKNYGDYKNFDGVFTTYFQILANLGRNVECDELIEQYGSTVQTKDVRYINYCDLRCYLYWLGKDYLTSIEWGQKGKDLKDRFNVDTKWSTDHHLALAQRDSGFIDPALKYFLQNVSLEVVIDPEEFDEDRGGAFYGNIGRCLHLMGQIDPAIICYRKSAIILQGDNDQHVENQGFIRSWIGELLVAKSDFCSAKTFLVAAKQKWLVVCPPRNLAIDETLSGIAEKTTNCPSLDSQNIERYCLAWIYGREKSFISL